MSANGTQHRNGNGAHHNANDAIPFVDLAELHREIQPELAEVFAATLRSAGFVGGAAVEGFEREFAVYCDSPYCIGVGSGTDALRFALMAAGVQRGDIVLTTPLTFIATTEAISQAGATPDFVDVEERMYTLDPERLRHYLEDNCELDRKTGRCFHRGRQQPVAAIIPVHLYGQMADMDGILELAKKYNLMVIEDACQAHGAEYFSKTQNRWCKAGSMGRAAAFSFYPGKNLGACGEGGAVTTHSQEISRGAQMLRDHGQSKKYYHDVEGFNGRLDALQAGILTVKLRKLTEQNETRRHIARRYDELLSSVPNVITPEQPAGSRSVYHLYVIRVQDREHLQSHLAKANIATGIHYPIPLHLQKAYEGLGYKAGDFPTAEAVASEILSLPMYPHLQPEQQRRVVSEIQRFVSRQASSATRQLQESSSSV